MLNYHTLCWVAVIIVFIVVEAMSTTLFGACFVIGGLAAFLAALFGITNFYVQLLIFAIVSVISIVVIKPILKTKLKSKEDTRTNVDTVIEAKGLVLNEINNVLGTGTVKVSGKEWSAKSISGDIIPVGAQVTVLRVEGVKLIVTAL